jgi:hypothetical protein
MTDETPRHVEAGPRAWRARISPRAVAIEALGLAGAAAALYGVWQFSPPLAWIVGGAAAIAVAVALAAGAI